MNFTYCTTFPGGTPLSNPGSTPSTGIELGGRGTPNTPFMITDNLSMVASGQYNSSGAFIQQFANLSPGSHRFELRANASLPVTDVWLLNVEVWTDDYTDFQNGYNGWILHNAARSGSIRIHAGVKAFFNFTDQGAPTGFAGTVLYKDLLFIPGSYSFWMQACHVPDSPAPGLLNPILSVIAGIPGLREDKREVPKNGIWYDFLLTFNVTARQVVRLYINNWQDGSHGNDFGIRNIRVVRNFDTSGIQETPNEAPLYTGPLPDIVLPA